MIQVSPLAPIAMVAIGGLHLAMMPDKHIAIFDDGELTVCECDGEVVESLPAGAEAIAGLVANGRTVSILRDGNDFYTLDTTGSTVRLAQADICKPMHTDFPDMPKA